MLVNGHGGAVVYAEMAGKFYCIPARWSGQKLIRRARKRRTTAAPPFNSLFLFCLADRRSIVFFEAIIRFSGFRTPDPLAPE
jgi:hypothetical protein